jgi:hypothetical protein
MKKAKGSTFGRPAPFTPEQIAALNAGKANIAEVSKVLKAHRQPRLSPGPQKEEKRAPIPLTSAQLRELASGRGTPASVITALEKSSPPQGKRRRIARPPRRPEYNPPAAPE